MNEKCMDCGRSLDTKSRRRCRSCLDRNRDQQRKRRIGNRKYKPCVCQECYGTGHATAYCVMRGV